MPNQDDVRALDILASGSQPEEVNFRIKTKLGLDDEDVRAWQLSKQADQDTSDRLQAKVLDKVRTQQGNTVDDSIKATVAGAAQGVTFGFSDEIIAATKAGWQKFTKGGDASNLYKKIVKKERTELKRLEDEYPLQFIGAELGAAILTPIPGSRVRAAGIAGKTALKAGQLALEAGATAAGKAEASLISKQGLEEVAKGAALGAGGGILLGKAGKKAAELVKKGDAPAKRAAQVVSNVLFDLPPAYTEKLLNKRTAAKILNPKSEEEIVESIMDMTKNMGQHAKGLSLKASQELSEKKSIDVNDILKSVGDLPNIQKVHRSTLSEANKAKKEVLKAVDDLKARADGGKISEIDLKQFVQDIDMEVPWNKLEWQLKDKILGDIRSIVSNDYLKRNQKYAEAMIPVDRIMNNLTDISKSFSLKRKGYSFSPSDATYSKVKGFFDVAGRSKKPVTEKALIEAEGRIAGPARPTILEDIEIAQIAKRTEGGMPAGSKHVLMGLAGGSLFGAPIWGAVAGAVKDRYGRKIGKELLPKMIGSIDFTDKAVKKGLEKIDPELLQYMLQTTGRVTGASQGVEAAREDLPPLLPRR